jgi:RimJ/RimL family protein N-acetyltransferase
MERASADATGAGAVQPTLRTERLVLRPFRLSDAATVQRLAGERALADTTVAIPHPYPDGAAEEWISTHAPEYAKGTQATYAITFAAGGELVGAISLLIFPAHARGELGYWVAVPHWNQGIATEAARAVVGFGFEHLKLHRIQAGYFVRNPASGRVMEKLRMRFEGIRRGALKKWDVFEDVAVCAILDSEWGGSMVSHGAGSPPIPEPDPSEITVIIGGVRPPKSS